MPTKKDYAHGTCKQMLLYVSLQHQDFLLALRNELSQAIRSGLCSEATACSEIYVLYAEQYVWNYKIN